MPKISKIDIDALLRILTEKKDSIADEKTKELRPPSHSCWLNIQKLCGFTILVKYIFLILKYNRYDSLNKLGLNLFNDKQNCTQQKNINIINFL